MQSIFQEWRTCKNSQRTN